MVYVRLTEKSFWVSPNGVHLVPLLYVFGLQHLSTHGLISHVHNTYPPSEVSRYADIGYETLLGSASNGRPSAVGSVAFIGQSVWFDWLVRAAPTSRIAATENNRNKVSGRSSDTTALVAISGNGIHDKSID